MGSTKNFREQHEKLLTIVKEIQTYLTADKITAQADTVKNLLFQLFGKLNVHLSMEDKVLYPKLLNHANEKVKSIAQKFSDEMGGIGAAVTAYKSKWPTTASIKNDPESFIEETKKIFSALSARIEKENNELYTMVDELD